MSFRFPKQDQTYFDSYKRGTISVRGFILEADEDGFIEGPLDIAKDIEPHGFIPMSRPVKSTTLGMPGRK
jgi:hypothetical protein